MSTYVIGDVQGCYTELQHLLEKINYNPDTDRLGFVGDLVNRGADSLHVLRFIKQLRNPLTVLGNHDLYLLIIGYGLMPTDSFQHTLYDVLNAPDKNDLLDWLRHQPFIIDDNTLQATLVHAGIPPQWTIKEALTHSKELMAALQGPNFLPFLKDLFGNSPARWSNDLQGQARLRYITNALTRMRICTQAGELDLKTQKEQDIKDKNFKPWYRWRNPNSSTDILFGHWAYLNGECDQPHCYALDTGCAWGHKLTAIRVEDKQRFSVASTS